MDMKHALWLSLLLVSTAHAQEPAKPEAVPPAESAPEAAPPEASKGPDTAALSAELSSVLDELTQARARASVLVKSLFRTQVEIWVARRADDQRMARIQLKLDGVPVHDSNGSAVAREEARLFAGHAAPGVHELTILVSEASPRNATYTYTREERFRFEIKKDTDTRIEILVRDDSDMAEELPEDDEGEYHVQTRVRIERKKHGGR
jgi:glucose/arabinose dehydrogenase